MSYQRNKLSYNNKYNREQLTGLETRVWVATLGNYGIFTTTTAQINECFCLALLRFDIFKMYMHVCMYDCMVQGNVILHPQLGILSLTRSLEHPEGYVAHPIKRYI